MIPLYTPPSNTPMKWRSLVHLITPNASRRSSVELLALDAAGGSFSGKRRRRRPSAPAVLEDLRRILAPARMLRRYHSSSMLVNEDSTESGGTISNAQHSNTRRKYSNPQSRALNHSDLHYVANVFSYCNSSSAAPASTQVQQGRRSAPTSPSSILFCHGRDLQLGLESGGATTVAQFGSSQAQQVQIGRNEPLSGGARFKCKRVKAARKSSAAPTSTLSSDEIRVGGESQPESLAQSTAGQSLSAAETQLQSQGHRRFAQLFKRKPAPVSSTVSKHRQERIRSISTAGLFRCSLSTSSGSAGSSVEPLLVGLESNLADGIILRSFGTVPQDAVRPVILHSFAKDLQSVIDKSNENCGNSNERIQQIQSQKEQKESETAYSDRVERHNVGTITVHAETRNYQTQTETDYSDFNGYSVRPDTLRLVASTQTQDEETQKDTIEEADTVARTTIAERADIESNLVDVSQRQRFKTPLSSTQEEEEKFCREKRASAAPSDSITCGCVQFLQNNNNIHNKNASFRRRNSDYSDSRRESVQKSSTRLSSLRGLKSKSGTSSGGVKLSPRLFLRGAKSSPAASPASSSSASERAATVAETVAGDTNANLYVRRHTVPNMTVAAYGMVICGTDNIHRRYRGRIEKVKFGIPISEAFVHDIPATLLVLLLKVNKEGPLKKDIWRAPGNQIQVRKLSAIMQQGRLVNISNISVYTAASVLKKFLSKLPGGIFGAENEKLLFGIAQQTNEEEQRKIFCRVVCGLSQPSQHLLVLLFGTFRVISDSADAFGTRMNADAIGISVAPSLFHTCIHDQRAKLEDVMRFKMASQVITRIIHGFGCTNLFPRECYEFYARITGRTLRVDDQWNFVFQYPSNANGTTTTSPVGDATPGVVALPAVVLRKSSSRASATTSGAVRARRSANRKSSTSSTTIPSMISSLQATCAVAAATAAAADVDDAKNRDLRTESEEEKIDDQQQSTVSLLTDVLRNENTHFKSTSFASLNNYNNFGSDGTNSYGGDASDIANTARYEYELRKSYKTQMLSKSGPETGLVFGADENSAPNDCANALKTSRTSINTRARENLGAVRAPMTSALSIGCLPNFTSKTAADFQRLRFCAQKQSQPHQQEDTISKDVQRAQSFKYETVVESSNNKLQDRDLHSYKGGTSIGTTNSSRFDFSESVKSYRDYDNAESRPTEPPIEVMTTNSSIAKAVNLRAKSPRNLQSMESHFRGTFSQPSIPAAAQSPCASTSRSPHTQRRSSRGDYTGDTGDEETLGEILEDEDVYGESLPELSHYGHYAVSAYGGVSAHRARMRSLDDAPSLSFFSGSASRERLSTSMGAVSFAEEAPGTGASRLRREVHGSARASMFESEPIVAQHDGVRRLAETLESTRSLTYLEWVHEEQTRRMISRSEWFLGRATDESKTSIKRTMITKSIISSSRWEALDSSSKSKAGIMSGDMCSERFPSPIHLILPKPNEDPLTSSGDEEMSNVFLASESSSMKCSPRAISSVSSGGGGGCAFLLPPHAGETSRNGATDSKMSMEMPSTSTSSSHSDVDDTADIYELNLTDVKRDNGKPDVQAAERQPLKLLQSAAHEPCRREEPIATTLSLQESEATPPASTDGATIVGGNTHRFFSESTSLSTETTPATTSSSTLFQYCREMDGMSEPQKDSDISASIKEASVAVAEGQVESMTLSSSSSSGGSVATAVHIIASSAGTGGIIGPFAQQQQQQILQRRVSSSGVVRRRSWRTHYTRPNKSLEYDSGQIRVELSETSHSSPTTRSVYSSRQVSSEQAQNDENDGTCLTVARGIVIRQTSSSGAGTPDAGKSKVQSRRSTNI